MSKSKEFRQSARDAWLFRNGPCRHCGSRKKLTVDHIDREDKDPLLRKRGNHRLWEWPYWRRQRELAKCQVLCQTCHRIKSHKENLGQNEMEGVKLAITTIKERYGINVQSTPSDDRSGCPGTA